MIAIDSGFSVQMFKFVAILVQERLARIVLKMDGCPPSLRKMEQQEG